MIVFHIDNSLWIWNINCVPTRVTIFNLWSFCSWKAISHAIIEIRLSLIYPCLDFEIWWGTWFVVLYLGRWFRRPRLGARSVEFGNCEHHICCTFQVWFCFSFSFSFLFVIKVLSDFHEIYALILIVTMFTHEQKFIFTIFYMAVNLVCQSRPLYQQQSWRRHLMEWSPFVHFCWASLYLRRWAIIIPVEPFKKLPCVTLLKTIRGKVSKIELVTQEHKIYVILQRTYVYGVAEDFIHRKLEIYNGAI